MGKYLSIVIGGGIAFVGLLLFIRWLPKFVLVVKGMLPAMLIFGGVIALIAGLSELKDSMKPKETK
ncbi:MAG: hypothetical protein PHS37_05105 [Candidatus Omnitrophica bacterium]|nr:hypothetical protein [Candidatus Omnitrophota bacterium]